MEQAQSFGESWEDQQRRWAGAKAAKAPATGPKTVEDFSEIEEADGGVHGDRYGYAGARQPTQKSTQGGSFPQGPWPASSDASRDSTSSVGSEARASSRWGFSLSRARSLSLSSLSLACSLFLSLLRALSFVRALPLSLSLSLSRSEADAPLAYWLFQIFQRLCPYMSLNRPCVLICA